MFVSCGRPGCPLLYITTSLTWICVKRFLFSIYAISSTFSMTNPGYKARTMPLAWITNNSTWLLLWKDGGMLFDCPSRCSAFFNASLCISSHSSSSLHFPVKSQGVMGYLIKSPEAETSIDYEREVGFYMSHLCERARYPCTPETVNLKSHIKVSPCGIGGSKRSP